MPETTPCFNLINNVTHDLKSPLHALLGFTDLVKTQLNNLPAVPERLLEHLDLMASIENDMLGLINNMLTTARLNSGQQAISPVVLTHDVFRQRLHELETTFKAEVLSRNIDFSLRYDRLPQVVNWDVKHIRYFVMNNLISNALKFVGNAGKVVVNLDTDENDLVSITVSDNGPGIAPAERKQIFERFRQSPDTLLSHENSGMGLYNAAQMIETHHGTIEIAEGLEGKGVSFIVRLPAQPFNTTAASGF